MPAFNHRFERATIAGIPLFSAIGGVVTFLSIAAIFLFPSGFIRFVCVIIGTLSLMVTVGFIWLGDDITFLKTIWNAFLESRIDFVTRESNDKY